MADKVTTQFPKMGEEALNWDNISVKASTSLRTPRKAYSMVEGAFANHRKQRLEQGGYKGEFRPRMSYPNSPEASATQRNVRTMDNRPGQADFWEKRQYGQAQQ